MTIIKISQVKLQLTRHFQLLLCLLEFVQYQYFYMLTKNNGHQVCASILKHFICTNLNFLKQKYILLKYKTLVIGIEG